MSEEIIKKKYRVIIIPAPVQFILDSDKKGEELNNEIKDRVLKVKPHPQEVIVAEVKEAPAEEIPEIESVKKEKNVK